jgi:hypothetical protein
MAITPAVYNITGLKRRADYVLELGFPTINLTGWTVAAQVWDEGRTTKYADWDVVYVNRITGSIKLVLPRSITILLPNEAFYDVLLTNPSNLAEYYLEGTITPDEGYTA